MYFYKISQTFKCLDLHCLRQKTGTQSDKGLAKITEGASPRRHAETSPVKVKDTHLMNNKLPPAEILCGDWYLFGFTFTCVTELVTQNVKTCANNQYGWYYLKYVKL